ncbi:MAG: nucleotidyl transferase AbiEii/AbiGii toxin family protein [Candidatus Dormibacteria bacterium]
MISKGAITRRANDEKLPAQTIERDYVLSQLCAHIGARGDRRLVLKGGTLLRLCYFDPYRYSADLDFSAIDGLSRAAATAAIAAAASACQGRLELPALDVSRDDGATAWVTYVGPLMSRPRSIKLDISDTELVTAHTRLDLQPRWPDLLESAAIEGYVLNEVGAEKLRCLAERLQCRDLYDLHELLRSGQVDVLEAWELYLRKAANDLARDRQRTDPREWAAIFNRRLIAYRSRWERELGDYLALGAPPFEEIERRTRRGLAPALVAARALAS